MLSHISVVAHWSEFVFVDPVPVKTELCLDNVTTYDDGLGGIQMSLGSLNLTGVHYSDVVMNSDTNKLEDFGGLVGIGKFLPRSVVHNKMIGQWQQV
jgi:hypothetical protein